MEKRTELGALWVKRSAKGEYMTGTITVNGEKMPVVVFYNANKKNEKEPDWRILPSQPRDASEGNALPEREDLEMPF